MDVAIGIGRGDQYGSRLLRRLLQVESRRSYVARGRTAFAFHFESLLHWHLKILKKLFVVTYIGSAGGLGGHDEIGMSSALSDSLWHSEGIVGLDETPCKWVEIQVKHLKQLKLTTLAECPESSNLKLNGNEQESLKFYGFNRAFNRRLCR